MGHHTRRVAVPEAVPVPTVPAVRLRSAVCVLGRFPALTGVDLEIAQHEIVLVSGPNGAGKTTLLRLLAGLAGATRGTVEVLGHDLVADRRAVRGEVALVGHSTGGYDDLSVSENLRFFARAAGRAPTEGEAAMERLGLASHARVAIARLSAGQRRRLALATALTCSPRLLLLDEPHAGLDDDGRARLDEVILAAPGEGRTVVLASHERQRARALARREVALVAGRVDLSGTGPARMIAPALEGVR